VATQSIAPAREDRRQRAADARQNILPNSAGRSLKSVRSSLVKSASSEAGFMPDGVTPSSRGLRADQGEMKSLMRSHLSVIALPYSLSLTLVLALFTPCALTGALDTTPEAVPPALNFGTVYVGSVVEGGFGIDGTNLVEVKSAPAWITVLEVDPEAAHPEGRGNVELRVDTSSPGVFSGAVVVETEAGDISVPVSVEVRDSPPPRLSVLVYQSPFHPMATPDPSHHDHLRELMESAMVNVSYVEPMDWPQISGSLDQFDVVILGDRGVWCPDPDKLKDYVRSGGYLVVFASRAWVGQTDRANQVVEDLGLRFRDEEIGYNVEAHEIADHWLTEGVSRIKQFRPAPVETISAEATVITSYAGSPPGEGMMAFSRVGDGGVLAVGSPIWWCFFLGRADNDRVLLNLFDQAAAGAGGRGGTPTTTPAPTTTQPPTQTQPPTRPPKSPAATTPAGSRGGGWLSTTVAAAIGAVAGAVVVALAVWAASRSRPRAGRTTSPQGDEKAITY